MPKFKVASRTADEMKVAAQTLNEEFGIVKGKGGRVDHSAIKELEANKWELATLIMQLINDNVATTDPTGFLVDQVSGSITDDYLWQEIRADIRVVNRSYGSKPLSQRITFKEFPMSTTHKEVAVEIPLEEIASGRTTPALVAEVMAEAINRYKVSMILDAIDAGVPSGADRSGVAGFNLRYVGFTEANLTNAIDGVMDEGDTPTVFGRHIALKNIRDFANWDTQASESALEDFEQRGLVSTYRGANLVKLLDRYSRRTDSHLISADKMYVSSGRKGAFYMTKDVSFLDWVVVDPRTATFGVGTRLEDGVLVWDPFQYRIISRT